ncbi:MAG: hypothetical protein A2X13_14710 [Bacteroidetes bacterium GWC2_33_15]|nr:MAG: hypothetical protein A2X10_06775 [Bacteroidetes bacterium GWA2_33_15]OFX50124.1 MAG: hypothetical protein A2X13_14710 [Bacteroidetes bacterium GWC2_33_15]OFX65277.1 MAG: hypothetical protein A2X15_04285 [Bacteroidetes bacterium GWB2_32_14]OFX70503.1 MAG: hypothetical protein A2X14_04340 [Bacteroidetes bacterium GWD2_33_33]HAN19624.1 hypothetical protein [Bacteroidales bacterium]
MANRTLKLNPAQLISVLLNPKHEVQVWGRGTGKSNSQGNKVDRIVKSMPRSSSVMTGKTYMQLLTRTLPPMISFLERMGYLRNRDFFIGKKPPKIWGWREPYEAPLSYEHYMVFGNPQGSVGFHLTSQDRVGSGRGLNTDFELTDETLTIDIDRYNKEIHATNRGNLNRFGKLSWHHGTHHSTSMPYSNEGKWLLDAGDYYEKEAGIRYKELWNRIVKMQLDLLEIEKPNEFAAQWNEIQRIRKRMTPFVSKKGMLFTLANAFDNIDNVGMSYIREQYRTTPRLTFFIEIMNMIVDKVEDCYYNINLEKQVYHDSYNYSFIDSLDYNFKKLGSPDSRFDKDVESNKPLKIVPDWGASISFLIVVQDNTLVDPDKKLTKNYVKEFFAKPNTGHVMIDDVVDDFCKYYRFHNDRTVIYYKDKYGDERQPNTGVTYNQQAIDKFRKLGWNVMLKEDKAKEPPHHEKYLLWTNVFKENNEKFPVVRINGNNCQFLIIAMQNTKVIEREGQFKKDKTSEHIKSKTPPEEATHSTDAADKILWVDYNSLSKGSDFIAARI